MVKFGIGLVLGAALVLVVHSKMESKTEASLNHTVGSQVDTASSAALDGMQTGLNKAGAALSDARKPGKK